MATGADPEVDPLAHIKVGDPDPTLNLPEGGFCPSGDVVTTDDAPRVVRFTVYGTPVPQGSSKAFVVKGRAIVTSDNKQLRPWRAEVAHAAREAWEGRAPLDEPVAVAAAFTLSRPASRPKRDKYPDRKPDLDKLIRGLLDGLTGPLLKDDARVVMISASKVYVGAPLATAEPSVIVTVWRLT